MNVNKRKQELKSLIQSLEVDLTNRMVAQVGLHTYQNHSPQMLTLNKRYAETKSRNYQRDEETKRSRDGIST